MGTTTNYNWEYADVGADENTWGTINSTLFQAIDTDLKTLDDAVAKTADNETISGTWTFSNAVAVAAPVAGGDAVNKTYADANYVGSGGAWQWKSTTTISGTPQTVAIDDTGSIYSGQTNVKLKFVLRHVEIGAASNIGSFGFQVSDDGGTTIYGGSHTSWPLPKDTDSSNNSSVTLASDSSSFVDFFDKSGTPGNNRNRGEVCGEIIIYQDTGIGNRAMATWDLIFEDMLSGDGVRVSGGAVFNPGGAIDWVRFVGNAYTTGTPAFVDGGKIEMWIQEEPS